MIALGSRYADIEVTAYPATDGNTIAYLRRRFVPPPERFALLQEHVVRDGDRPDLLAYQYLGDPEQYWRIADANAVFWPEELTEPGRRVRITLPEGIPGIPANA